MLEQAVLVFAAISAIGSACGDHAITTTELFRFRHDPETPCVRIPSLVTVPGGVVVALAECRQFVGDGCRPWDDDNASLREPSWGANRYICSRRSTDYGRSFGPWQHNITRMRSWNPATAVIDRTTTKHGNASSVLLFFNDGDAWLKQRPSAGGTPWLVRSFNLGLTWGEPSPISIEGPLPAGAAGGFNLGPGRALVLDSGRILLAGGSSIALGKCPQRSDGGVCKQLTSFVLHSDDHGKTFHVSSDAIPDLEEPQLAEYLVPHGSGSRSVVVLNGRQNNSYPIGSPCGCRGQVYSTDEGLTFAGGDACEEVASPGGNSGAHVRGGSDGDSDRATEDNATVSWIAGLPSPSVQSSIIRLPRSGRLVFAGPRSHDRNARVNFTLLVSPPRASVGQLWSANATLIPLTDSHSWPCFGYQPNCAGYSCLAVDESPATSGTPASKQESVLVLWETGVASGCTGAACRIMLSRVPLPL